MATVTNIAAEIDFSLDRCRRRGHASSKWKLGDEEKSEASSVNVLPASDRHPSCVCRNCSRNRFSRRVLIIPPTCEINFCEESGRLKMEMMMMAQQSTTNFSATEKGPREHASWSPYDNNGGTCVAVAGANYCVIAADTRMSTGFSILTRDASKIFAISDKCVLASSGFQADIRALQKNLDARHLTYQHQHGKQMSCPAMAQLLSNTLYYKRFFPYYAFNVLGGLDSQGKGCVYSYDAVGSYERVGYSCQGTGMQLIMPVLDNQLKSASPLLLPVKESATPLTEAEAVDLVKDTFASAAERDIYTGDGVEIIVINADGVRREFMDLKRD